MTDIVTFNDHRNLELERLYNDIFDLVDKFAEETPISGVTIVGILEAIKMDVITAQMGDADG